MSDHNFIFTVQKVVYLFCTIFAKSVVALCWDINLLSNFGASLSTPIFFQIHVGIPILQCLQSPTEIPFRR
jgi:hypothetical protein